ncbi:hypothetical protein KC909_05970 [Candidatus Dojkabacteria bacterium]|uniref:Uncharacterized protein n=1 Tax=Candidatus Dojkabacteria bacterium TaxID=2099670 RepID=A0A955L6Q9_9BACT|nr:hypothetical protein [Candidatus Dojkabacteria bacterium]
MMTKELLLRLFGVTDLESEAAKSILADYDDTVSRIMLLAIQEWMNSDSTADTESIKNVILSLKEEANIDLANLAGQLKGHGKLLQIFTEKVEQYHDAIFSAQLLQLEDFELDELEKFLQSMESDSNFNKEELQTKINEKLGNTMQSNDTTPKQVADQVFDFSVIPGSEAEEKTVPAQPEVPVQNSNTPTISSEPVQENVAKDVNMMGDLGTNTDVAPTNNTPAQPTSGGLMNLGGKMNQSNEQ